MTTKVFPTLLLSIISYFSYSQCQMIIRPDSTTGQDAKVWSLDCNSSYAIQSGTCETTNYSDDPYLAAYAWTHLGAPTINRSFLRFDLDELSAMGCQVTSAKLMLFNPGDAATQFHCGSASTLHPCNSNQLDVRRVDVPWVEDTIVWDNQPTVTSGTSTSDLIIVPDQSDPLIPYEIDITDMVNLWLTQPNLNNGLRVSLSYENYYTRVFFASSNHSNPNYRPTLVLELNCPNLCSNMIEGDIYDDANGNCVKDGAEQGLANWYVEIQPGPFYAISDTTGHYQAWVGNDNYTVTQVIPNTYLYDTICPTPYTHNVVAMSFGDTTSNVDFAVQANSYCPDLTVDLGTGFFRKGHVSPLFVQYCNNGNVAADSTYITIDLDSALTPLTSTLPWNMPQTGNTYTFYTGMLQPGECGYFTIDVQVGLDVFISQTLCAEAIMYPDFNCNEPEDTDWDRSSVMVTGACVDDSLACFTILNTGDAGDGDMMGTSEYRIYENNVLVYVGTFQLNGQDDVVICWPTNGNTIRLEADQRPGHPGNSHPNDVVEACGEDLDGNFRTGYVLDMPLDDQDNNVAIECHEVIFSYDPNDKTAIPNGIDEQGYIMDYDELEYRIRFQNTGNDTAFNIIVRDTLSGYLDPTTVISGVSSHSYDFNIYGNGILEWNFSNIMLPDSNVNEPGSHGFVKFKVKQKHNNIPGTEITNKVGIYFDYNEPVITNTTLNTIWEGQFLSISEPVYDKDHYDITVAPNPFDESTSFTVKGNVDSKTLTLVIYDISGRNVKTIRTSSHVIPFQRENLKSGIYTYSITSDDEFIGTGKIIVK